MTAAPPAATNRIPPTAVIRSIAGGSAATVFAWIALSTAARALLIRSTTVQPSTLAVHYLSVLFIVGLFAGVFGGMTAALLTGSPSLSTALGVGAASQVLVAVLCALLARFKGSPDIGLSAYLWAAPLAVAGIAGAGLGRLVMPHAEIHSGS